MRHTGSIASPAARRGYAVLEEPIALTKDGCFDRPQRPGLGVSIREDLCEKTS
jgi:L-alanine-DL-glutamate epimerase-like enolase superfamily enzyme